MTSDNLDTYIKIIYTANVTAQLSILFLSKSVVKKRVELQVYYIQRRQFRLLKYVSTIFIQSATHVP